MITTGRALDDQKDRRFWVFLFENSMEVGKWPKWMRGGEGMKEPITEKEEVKQRLSEYTRFKAEAEKYLALYICNGGRNKDVIEGLKKEIGEYERQIGDASKKLLGAN